MANTKYLGHLARHRNVRSARLPLIVPCFLPSPLRHAVEQVISEKERALGNSAVGVDGNFVPCLPGGSSGRHGPEGPDSRRETGPDDNPTPMPREMQSGYFRQAGSRGLFMPSRHGSLWHFPAVDGNIFTSAMGQTGALVWYWT